MGSDSQEGKKKQQHKNRVLVPVAPVWPPSSTAASPGDGLDFPALRAETLPPRLTFTIAVLSCDHDLLNGSVYLT